MKLNEDLVVRREKFGSLVHFIPKGLIYVLNETGQIILEKCNNNRTTDDIINEIKNEYECDGKELREFINELIRAGIIIDGKPQKAVAGAGINPMMSFESNPLSRASLSSPLVLYWEITNVCNLRCLHCYKNASVAKPDELNTEEIKKVIDQLAEQKVFWVAITGGEPLMKKDIFEIIKYATSKKICIMLSSNGTLMTEEKARKLKEAGVLSIQISIDGIGKVHDEFRGMEGAFDKAVNAVKILVKEKIPDVTISSVATRHNMQSIPGVIDLAVSLGVTRYRIITLMPTGRAMDNIKRLWLNDKEKKELRRLLTEASEKYSDKIQISQEERSFNLLSDEIPHNEVPLGCAACKSICKISPEGDVYPCSYFDDEKTKAGNLREKSFKEIWDNSRMFRLLRNMDHIEGKCAHCSHLKFCGGGCRAVAYNFHGSLYAEDPECWLIVK